MPEMKPQLKERLKSILRLDGWCSYGKAIHLAQIIIDHRPEVIVEVGVFGGRSAIAMAMACQHAYTGKVHAIDPWTKAAALEGGTNPENDAWWSALDIDKIYRTFMSNVRTLGVEDWIEVHRVHDVDALPLFRDGSVNLFHLDSNHSEAVSVRSVRDWIPKVAAGGFVFFDDISWPSQLRALELLKNDLGLTEIGEFDMHDEKGEVSGRYALFQKPA